MHVGHSGVIADHSRRLRHRTTETGGVELEGNGAGLAGLDLLVPIPRRCAAASGPNLSDLQRRRSNVGEDGLIRRSVVGMVHQIEELGAESQADAL